MPMRPLSVVCKLLCGLTLSLCAFVSHSRAEDAPPSPDHTAPVENANLPLNDWTQRSVGKDSPLYINGQIVHPAGKTLDMHRSPCNLALAQGGRFLVAKCSNVIAVLDAQTFKVIKQTDFPAKDRGTLFGLAVSADGSAVYATSKDSKLIVGALDKAGVLTLTPSIDLKAEKGVYPLGVALAKNDTVALVALSLANQLAVVDLAARKVAAHIDVGVCPYCVVVSADGRTAFVSNYGGPRPRAGDKTELAEGTPVAVDARSIALRGSVSVVDWAAGKVTGEIETPPHSETMALSLDGKTLYVVDACGDGIAVIDVAQRKVLRQLNTKPRADLPYGSLTCGLAISADGATLYAANGGNNALALIDPTGAHEGPLSLIPTGAFPGAVCVSGNDAFVGNVEGFGGDLQKVSLPATDDERKKLTAAAEDGFHFAEIVRTLTRARAGVAPVPVPVNPGEPSPLKHVVYIIKENKKFDQILGDMPQGNCDPKLCEFKRAITPNAHALAEEFVLLDNYYCCSGNSATGHQWAVQGLISPQRAKGEAPRVAYDFGTDALTYAGCGFIWDHALRQGVSFRNFGEMDYPRLVKGKTWTDFYQDWKTKSGRTQFECDYKVETLRNYSDKRYPGWELSIPDQVRADAFLVALKEYEAAGKLPEFIIIYLPDDHTNGGSKSVPTPRAYVADNDLAFGRVVEGLSKSSFWKDMVVISNEDDPQTGADHVSGYRSVCFVASPYAKRGAVVSRFYNQASVLHTFCNILGIPPMNQMVASSPLMSDCFQSAPNFAPYVCKAETVALDEMNGEAKSKNAATLEPQTLKMNFAIPDALDKRESEIFSRYVWATTRGDEPFPVDYWGPHGKGLQALGLTLEAIGAEKDDND